MAQALQGLKGGPEMKELSPVLSKYLDRHLVFPLLEFLQVYILVAYV
jgi:hypothetical protein